MTKLWRDIRGGITVFVTLILIISVTFIGLFIDLAIFAAFPATDALRLQNESILSNYDGLLKDTYGLFALSRDAAEPVSGVLTLNPFDSEAGTKVGNPLTSDGYFYPMRKYSFKIVSLGDDYNDELVRSFSLGNPAVLQTQISDYMKYRGIATFFDDAAQMMKAIEGFDKLKEDQAAIESKAALEEAIGKLEDKYKEYYGLLLYNDDFDELLPAATAANLTDYAKTINDSYDAIASKESEIASLEAAERPPTPPTSSAAGSDGVDNSTEIAGLESDIDDLNDKIKTAWADGGKEIEALIETMSNHAVNMARMKVLEIDIESQISIQIRPKLEAFKVALSFASEDMREACAEDLKTYNDMFGGGLGKLGSLQGVSASLSPINLATIIAVEAYFPPLEFSGKVWGDGAPPPPPPPPPKADNPQYTSPPVLWKLVKHTKPGDEVFAQLKEWYPDEEAAKDKSNSAKNAVNNIITEKASEIKSLIGIRGATSMPAVWKELIATSEAGSGMEYNNADGEEFGSFVDGFKKVGNRTINKLLTIEYAMGMFSCMATNKVDGAERDTDTTLTGNKMSRKFNYFYGSELEYIFVGSSNALANNTGTQLAMTGVLAVRNFPAFMKSPARKEINGIVKAIPNPLIQIGVKAALSGLVITAESTNEYIELVKGSSIKLFKRGTDWKFSLKGLVEGVIDEVADVDGKPEKAGQLDYEMLMKIMLCFGKSNDVLLERTGNLIAINLDNYKQDAEGNQLMLDSEESRKNQLKYMDIDTDTQIDYDIGFIFEGMLDMLDTSGFKSFNTTRSLSY